MIRCCIFDLDGTLCDTILSIATCANLCLQELGLAPRPLEQYYHYVGNGTKELARRVLIDDGDTELTLFDAFHQRYMELFQEYCTYQVRPYDRICETLHSLKQEGVKLAVLSNKPESMTQKVIREVFGSDYFDKVQGQCDDIPRKPAPDGAKILADYFAVKPEQCLYIGDTNTDMQTGNRAGMHTIGVLWGFRDRQELEANHAEWIVEKPEEILDRKHMLEQK